MTLLIFLILAAALIAVAMWLRKAQSPQRAHIHGKAILTANELEFFHRLCRALPDFFVFPQVAANALLEVEKGIEQKQRAATRNRFAQKHVDFVVCERTSLEVLAIIELDDSQHNVAKDKLRDALFEEAGYVVHRFQSKQKPSEAELARLFAPAMNADLPALADDSAVQF